MPATKRIRGVGGDTLHSQRSQKTVGSLSMKSQDCNLLSSEATGAFRASGKEKVLNPPGLLCRLHESVYRTSLLYILARL